MTVFMTLWLCFFLCATVQLENHTQRWVREDALYGEAVERYQQSLCNVALPEDPEDIEPQE